MTGYSVMTRPSSRWTVGTLPLGLISAKGGFRCSPPRRSRRTASYGLPISSSRTWMPTEQAPGEKYSFIVGNPLVEQRTDRALLRDALHGLGEDRRDGELADVLGRAGGL